MIITTSLLAEFAADVRRDLALAPKQLQSKYLYDALGSSLFEAICRLPWYRITRAESGLLSGHAADVVAALGEDGAATIVELGCGSGEKLVVLAEALQAAGGSARVHLIDVSSQALEQT
jgi:L-histidine Nalpha-methyltransferase